VIRRSPHDREILRLALPALGALAAEPLYVLADTAIVGHLGRPQIAALGLAGAVLGAVFGAFNFLAYGTTAVVARASGAGHGERAARRSGSRSGSGSPSSSSARRSRGRSSTRSEPTAAPATSR
jgi:Na+-driven multidrug efflux pump